jgi:hypothetical protein
MTLDLDLDLEFARLRPPLNLYRLTQDLYAGYDTYDSCIVAAVNEGSAKEMHPSGGALYEKVSQYADWPSASEIDYIDAELVGIALPGSMSYVICSSFNAG